MRLPWILSCVGFLYPYLSTAISSANVSSEPVPSCMTPCVLDIVLGEGKCTLGNYAPCYCRDIPMQRSLSACIQEACAYQDQEIASFIGQKLCEDYPQESRVSYMLSMGITFFVITLIILLLRLYTRYVTLRKLWPDDYVALCAGVCFIGAAITGFYACAMGYGKHLWYLPMGQDIPLLKALYALSIFYIGVQSMSKISLLLLFKRIYPSPRFRLCCEAGIIFVTLHCVAFTISIIFQCSPINSYWDHRIKRKCLNSTAIGYAGAVFSILEDFVILGMPIPQLLRLQVKTGQKIALILLFSVGSFACIVSIVRLKYLNDFKPSSDLTWDKTDLLVWSLLEVELTLICACLPALRPLMVEIVPSFWRSFTGTSTQSSNNEVSTKFYSNLEPRTLQSSTARLSKDLYDQSVTVTTTIETFPSSCKSSVLNANLNQSDFKTDV